MRSLFWALMYGSVSAWAIPPEMPLRALSFQSWGQEAGLPQISVHDMARDAQGYWWIGTENGLARFDGLNFETFRQADTPALKSSWISRLHVDRAGRLWVGTIKNLAVYEGGRFNVVTVGGMDVGKVSGMAEEPGTGALYVAADGLFRFQDGQLQAVAGWQGPATATLSGPDAVWVAAPKRLVRIANGVQQTFALPTALADAVVTEMAWASDALWLASTRGLLRFSQGRFESWPLDERPGAPVPSLQSLAADGTDGLWAGSDRMLYRLHAGRVIERLDTAAPGALPWPITIKAERGSLWLGSQSEGLQHYWRSETRRFSVEEGLKDPLVWSYAEDGARLLIGTNSGVAVYAEGRITPWIDASSLPNPVAYSLLQDAAKRLWVGTRAGLARFTPDGRLLDTLPAFAGLQINGLLQAADASVWAATSDGLFRIAGEQVRRFGEAEGLGSQRIRYLLQARDGTLWVGTESGLYRQRAGRFEAVVLHGQAEMFITCLTELADGRLAVGTYEHGIYLRSDTGLQHWGPAQGLPSHSVFYLATVGDWLVGAGADGVYRIALSALATGAAAPLPVEVLVDNPGERQGRSRLRCCNGGGNGKGLIVGNQAWLATLDGALRVTVDGPARIAPVATIQGIEHDHQKRLLTPDVLIETLPRDVLIRYGVVDYHEPARLQFRYRLNGFDKGWVEAGERRSAIYTNLPPGRFTLEVQARNPFGIWGPSAEQRLEVPKRFIETWTFRTLCAAALLLLVLFGTRFRLRRLEAQKRALEAVVAERTRALAESNARLAAANVELKIASHTDALTGLYNRRFLEECIPNLRAQLARRRMETGRDLVIGVILIDIDYFKRINDRFGHVVGDLVLQRVAAGLQAAVRESEFVLRWGGEEFLAILEVVERSQVGAVALRLHQTITESCAQMEVTPGQAVGTVTASLGFASYPMTSASAEHNWQTAIEVADHALYAAKAGGRNRCVTYDLDRLPASVWLQQINASDITGWIAAGEASEQVLNPQGY